MKVKFLVTFFLLMSFQVISQKTLYLSPAIGVENPYCSLEKNITNAPTFKPNYFDIGLNLGLLLKLQFNSKWTLSTGISSGNIGWGFRVTTLRKNTLNPSSHLPEKNVSVAKFYHRFPLLLSYNLKYIQWLPITKKNEAEQLFIFAFDIQAVVGLSYNRIGGLSGFNEGFESTTNFIYGDRISYNMTYNLKRNWGSSVIAGLGLQFYRLNKPTFNLFIFYSQGLMTLIEVAVDYDLNGEKFKSTLNVRGSIVGVQLTYPFRIKKFK